MKTKVTKDDSVAKRSRRAGGAARASARFSDGIATKIQTLAEWLRQDIRRRGLQPGDRYMTSEEAARLLDVSTGTAHQAMRILVEENVLCRRQRQGTYVGPAIEPPQVSARPRVYLLTPSDAIRDTTYSHISDAICPAILRTLGGAALQIEYLPAGAGLSHLRRLVTEAEATGNLAGFVLIRSTFEVQSFFQENRGRFPSVISGGVYPGITELAWVNSDQYQIGRLTAEYLLRAGHRRVSVLMHEHWAPGDSQFVSGMTEAMETSSHHVERFKIYSLPSYELPIRHHVQKVLSEEDRPTAIVGRMAFQISVAFDVVKEAGLSVPGDIDIVLGNLGFISPLSVSIPHAVSEVSMDEVGEILGQMLAAVGQGRQPDPREFLYPVRFVERS